MTPPATEVVLDADHRYWVGDRELPSVTRIIRAIHPGWSVDDWYLNRGSMIHKAVHLYLQRRLVWDTLDDRIKGRVQAVVKFLADTKLEPVVTEKKLWSSKYWFAGTCDALLSDGIQFIIADWKSSLDPVACDPQIGAYSLLLGETCQIVPRGLVLELHDDATYKCRWASRRPVADNAQFDLTQAENTFKAMLTVYNHKLKHGAL